MLNLQDLIGMELSKAKEKIKNETEFTVEVIINAKNNDLCDSLVVCNAKLSENIIKLYCGEFNLGYKV